jgi:hypothetical protein
MGDCKLTEATSKLKGTTLFAEGDGCISPTAIYISEKHTKTSGYNVILWFHGHHVKDMKANIFGPDLQDGETKLRESIDTAGQDVILIVPHLGLRSGKVDTGYGLGRFDGKGKSIKDYLDQILGLIGKRDGRDGVKSSDIDRLVLACHSGSDYLMRGASRQLGDDLKKGKLKEFWGYDCINSGGQTFATWAAGFPGVSFYFYVATGSIGYGHFSSYLIQAYGTPRKPKKPPMARVFLTPATNVPDVISVPDSQLAESFDDIDQKQKAKQGLSAFEKMRLETDPELDKGETSWAAAVKKHTLKHHYEVVEDMMPTRIARLFVGKP